MIKRPLLTGGIIGLFAIAIGLLATVPPVSAQTPTNTGGQALEIGPPVINLTVNPGQTITTKISLRDVSSGRLLVTGEVNDFVASGEDGTPKILLDDSEASPYSFKTWVAPLPQLLLKPREIQNLSVTIKVPVNASPGGYYGVIRFTATAPELKGTGVSLSASLGSLVLIKVNGAVKEKLTIEEFSANTGGKSGTLFEAAPIQFVERFNNTGNIHEEPTGLVTITDMFKNKIATLSVNQPTRNILPQSIRKFDQPLDSTVIGNKQLFGRYTAELRVTYGANKQVVTSSFSFWVIPYRLIGLVIILLVGGFIGLRIFIKRYNRHIVERAQKARRK